jgi:low affinity Fe/Cu permease
MGVAAKAIHLKLDELVRSIGSARNRLVDLEELTDDELERLQTEFQRLSHQREARPRPGHRDTEHETEKGTPRDQTQATEKP